MKLIIVRRYGFALGAFAIACVQSASAAFAGEPWRLDEALGAPDWLDAGGSYRIRYETLDGAFRKGAAGSDQILVERLLFGVRAHWNAVYLGAELEDSRTQLADAGTPLGTDEVDTFEPLQIYAGLRESDVVQSGDSLDVRAGRITIDAGSRRLVARNRFRNTLNAFTGIEGVWTGAGGTEVQAFYVLPVQREPANRDALAHNSTQLDKESFRVELWGILVSQKNLLGRASGEVYLYGLHERDRPGVAVADRDLYTPGLRLFAKPKAGAWDFEIEGALQFGTSRFTPSPSDTADLDHFAGFFHGDVAYSFDVQWSPRLVLQYDYASGDEHPGDRVNNRFDTLFGARRFDFGPTGIYGAFARSNIDSPGFRIEAKPAAGLGGFIGYRAVWLAASRDVLTAANLRDVAGDTGNFVGHQIEAELHYDLLPGNLVLETGGAYLIDGPFLRHAPGAPHAGNTSYFYVQSTLSF